MQMLKAGNHRLGAVLLLPLLLLSGPKCGYAADGGDERPAARQGQQSEAAQPLLPAPAAPDPRESWRASRTEAQLAEEDRLFREAAERAWRFVERNYQSSTGLVRAHDTYRFVTTWDIASGLAAMVAAHELGIVDRAGFDRRISRALRTLGEMDLYEGAAFNKSYDASTGRMVDRDDRATSRGYGWSVTDIGRLLVWLRVIAQHHPQHAEAAEAVVRRLGMSRLIEDGYLMGEDLSSRGEPRRYQEGRIGYEQYAASGFAAWGYRAERALDVTANAERRRVMGETILADRRGRDRLTSDPFLMLGMEVGWRQDDLRELAWAVLRLQEARYRETGQLTMVNEDALPDEPFYFYYFTVYQDGEAFQVDAQGSTQGVRLPRWVSSKAAFGWHALHPTAYTLSAVEAMPAARTANGGWASGIYEGSGRSTGVENINTSGVILTAALYHQRGRPLLASD
jgi:hypothetical protein